MEMKEIKQGMARERKMLDEVETRVNAAKGKAASVSEKLASVIEELEGLEVLKQQAITDYARGNITSEELNAIVQKVQLLKPQKEAFEEALLVANGDLDAEKERMGEIFNALRGKEREFWNVVRDEEVARAVVYLKRALVAIENSGGDTSGEYFIKKHIGDKLYINTRSEEGRKRWNEFVTETTKQLRKEY